MKLPDPEAWQDCLRSNAWDSCDESFDLVTQPETRKSKHLTHVCDQCHSIYHFICQLENHKSSYLPDVEEPFQRDSCGSARALEFNQLFEYCKKPRYLEHERRRYSNCLTWFPVDFEVRKHDTEFCCGKENEAGEATSKPESIHQDPVQGPNCQLPNHSHQRRRNCSSNLNLTNVTNVTWDFHEYAIYRDTRSCICRYLNVRSSAIAVADVSR